MDVGVEFHLADISEQRGTEAGLLAGSQWHIQAGRRETAQLQYMSATPRSSLGGHSLAEASTWTRLSQASPGAHSLTHSHNALPLLIGQAFSKRNIEGHFQMISFFYF